MPSRPVVVRRWQIVTAFAAVTAAFVAGLVVVTHLSRQFSRTNRERIADIQQSRVESCERTYEGVREVFLPFFPPPKARDARQRGLISKLNRTVEQLKTSCPAQVRTG